MNVVRIGLWSLAITAGAIWLYSGAASIEELLGSATLASWAARVGLVDQMLQFGSLFVFFFLTIIVLSNILCGFRISLDPSPMVIALRGAPRWLRRTFYVSSPALLLAAFVHQWPPTVEPNWDPNFARAMAFSALISGFTCLMLVSGARLGLLPPKCPNGHLVGYKESRCGTCGAAIANVEF